MRELYTHWALISPYFLVIIVVLWSTEVGCDYEWGKKLYYDKIVDGKYNRMIRPVYNESDTVIVRLGVRLSQIVDLVSIPMSVEIN